MRLGNPKNLANSRERLIAEYLHWNEQGRPTVPTARILAGMYAVLYRKRYRLSPMSSITTDIEDFDALLTIVSEDKAIAPYCLEVLFSMKEFDVKAQAFANPNVIDRWNVVERANKIRSQNGSGEQAEFKSDNKKFGIIRV